MEDDVGGEKRWWSGEVGGLNDGGSSGGAGGTASEALVHMGVKGGGWGAYVVPA